VRRPLVAIRWLSRRGIDVDPDRLAGERYPREAPPAAGQVRESRRDVLRDSRRGHTAIGCRQRTGLEDRDRCPVHRRRAVLEGQKETVLRARALVVRNGHPPDMRRPGAQAV